MTAHGRAAEPPRPKVRHNGRRTPMTPKALTALQSSIAHWERNYSAEKPSNVGVSALACALCAEFLYDHNRVAVWHRVAVCRGCPIAEDTGRLRCGGTPYHEVAREYNYWVDAHTNLSIIKSGGYPTTEFTAVEVSSAIEYEQQCKRKYRTAASRELEYLKSLLPKEPTNVEEHPDKPD